MSELKIEIKDASYHRNGIGGAGFYAILLRDHTNKKDMIASLFDEPGHCAVYCVDELAKGNIAFAQGNSWRGDHYESQLRPMLKKYLAKDGTNRIGPFAMPQARKSA